MADDTDALHELAAAHGIDVEFWDWQGTQRHVVPSTLIAVLAAFGVDATTPEAQRDALTAHRRAATAQVLPPCLVMRRGSASQVAVGAAVGSAHVQLEDGATRTVEVRDGAARIDADLPTGYHELVAVSGGTQHRAHLIVAPDRLALPSGFDSPGWGLAAQLYSVLSRHSWGVGDLGDLTRLASWCAREHGADFVLVNPLHAGEVVAPLDPSPYSPTTRRFANPLYLDVPAVAEHLAVDDELRKQVDRVGDQARLAQLPDGLLDRDAAWAAKRDALGQLWEQAWPASDAHDDFAAYCAAEGDELERFATWCALTELHGGDWRAWPQDLHDPHGEPVRAAAQHNRGRVDFFRWLQWLLERQLGAAHDAARSAGARIGIIHDVAVGVSTDGADSWSWQDVLAADVSVGAPPDAYSQRGQDWHQPPWRPDRLAELGYAPLRELFRAALRHCGGLRVDHIIGMFRLWWIPAGTSADAGTYVHYDHDALIGVLMLEAQRADALVIGEDLGNVEPWVQQYLRERGVFGTSILWFESDRATGAPLAPQRWREQCLASVTTHDLPPTVGYLAGDHVRLRQRLGLLTRSVDEELAADRKDKQTWLDELSRCGLLPAGTAMDDPSVVPALHAFLTRTPALLRGVALTDVVGERRTQNQPGTRDEYPNWRIPLADADGRVVLLDDLIDDPDVASRLDAARG
ncbi:4-alpha-glucanotransferase [uncultured Jatrophihabitans sp.]|uniref:4-alpha-glucanotransferase n=1 Tax=uncultured Jatrophihabitans sp. TaxID=1610747 RepID=UPI0035CBFC9C